MDQISRDSPLEMLSDINPASPFPDDSFSKSPFNSALKSFAKLDIKSNSSIEGSFRDIIKRMQNEVDTLLHENAELKSRGSVSTDNQNVKSLMILIKRKFRAIIKCFTALKKRIRKSIIFQSNFKNSILALLTKFK